MRNKVKLVKLNWNEEHKLDLLSKKGYDVTETPFTKEKKNMNGLHSPRFATDWDDDDAFAERYRCRCGRKKGRKYENEICAYCGTAVTYKDADLSLTAWININSYSIIQPIYYNMLVSFIGKKDFPLIIKYDPDISLNGNLNEKEVKRNPFAGIGLIEFYRRYREIMRYYRDKNKKKPKKLVLYDILTRERSSVFAKHIPVYTSVLRPVSFKGENFVYSKIDAKFNMIYSQCNLLNDSDALLKKMERTRNKGDDISKLELPNILGDIQYRLMAVWKLVFDQITQKNGQIRDQILGGRVDYSARSVIRPDPTLRADEIKICYLSFLELYRYEIEMYISKLNDISISAASNIWYKARLKFDETVYDIMNHIIATGRNLVDLNRNPTINYGSYITVRIVGVTSSLNEDYTMCLPPAILTIQNADFDGDTLNTFSLKTHEMEREHDEHLNPTKNMFISRNDGLFNDEMNLIKDQIIGLYQFNNI